MSNYETTATVGGHGEIQIAGLPFVPGTVVEISIRERATAPEIAPQPTERISDVFARVRSGNTQSVGPLKREDLYDRKVLR